MTELLRGFDYYTRLARIYPAVIAIAPAVWTAPLVLGDSLRGSMGSLFLGTIIAAAGMALLANTARSLGKEIEPGLVAAWGGWPTTAMLRHRDGSIDAVTKGRYHNELRKLGLAIPTRPEEESAPEDADERYRSATRRLIELRRGDGYSLLLKENAAYGFRRNMLGLKPVALTILALSAAATVWRLWPDQREHALVAVSVDLGVAVIVWLVIVRAPFVRQAAIEYATALLRTLEPPAPEGPPKPTTRKGGG